MSVVGELQSMYLWLQQYEVDIAPPCLKHWRGRRHRQFRMLQTPEATWPGPVGWLGLKIGYSFEQYSVSHLYENIEFWAYLQAF